MMSAYQIYSNKCPVANKCLLPFFMGEKMAKMPWKLALGYQSILFFAQMFVPSRTIELQRPQGV